MSKGFDERIERLRELVGCAVLLPWPSGSKGTRRKWKHLQLTDMNDKGFLVGLKKAGNIGVVLGRVSDGLVTIDLDQDTCVDTFLAANPLFANTLRTCGSRGCNVWLRCHGEYPPSCKLTDPAGNKIGEWRADGNQTIIAGTHPTGVAYRFVVEKPVITINYEAINWPEVILPPDATESKRVRGVREKEVVCVCVGNGSYGLIEAFRARDLISQVAPTNYHQNNASLFKLARLVRSCESAMHRLATEEEREFVFDHWCLVARRFWRPGHTRDDYYAEFLSAYSCARIGLDKDPTEVALSRAKAGPLPQVRGFSDERVRLAAALCREMQDIMGDSPFFLPTRKLGEIFGVHHTCFAHWLRAFEFLGIIHLAPGEVRMRGGNRSPRYHYGPPQLAGEPAIAEALALSDVSCITAEEAA